MPGTTGLRRAGAAHTPPGSTGEPPRPVDVSSIKVGSAAFGRLPAAWQQAVRDARTFASGQLRGVSPPPRVLVVASPSNGRAPVTVLVPAGARAPLRVQTHYHGDHARALGANPAAAAIASQLRRGDATVFVLPEAAKVGAPTGWSNARSLGGTTDEALAAAGLSGEVEHRTLSVHSAGGRALVGALKQGESLRADHLVIQDALFESTSGRGVATFLKQRLPVAAAGVARITLVPSTGPGAAGLMRDLDEPRLSRTEVLGRELRLAGRAVAVVNVRTHDDAAGQLRPGGWTS
jgi:hypothetical protein